MGHFRKHKQIILCIGSLLLCVVTGLICYRLGFSAAPAEISPITLSVVTDNEAGFTSFSFEDTQSPYTSMDYVDLTQVSISIDGVQMPLDEAITNRKITIEELIAQAQLDAQNGICTEEYSSERGIATYVYIYPTYEFIVRHDIFEAADGSQIPINSFDIVAPGKHENVSFGWALLDDDGNHVDLLQEDWGLSFECVNVTSTGVELKIDQAGGQQVGELRFETISLNHVENGKYTHVGFLEEDFPSSVPEPIPQNSTTSFSLGWEAQFGSLAPGEYELWITVWDKYDRTEQHPFLKKYSDYQDFRIHFTIS